ncbi:MAG: hypothetical protein H6898_03920 [Rhodobacter sp.]|nr:hypothetical protein [Paracoccaceae bacterium]MCC0075714.1 hypothetical protein [Rhodobacter sp.]
MRQLLTGLLLAAALPAGAQPFTVPPAPVPTFPTGPFVLNLPITLPYPDFDGRVAMQGYGRDDPMLPLNGAFGPGDQTFQREIALLAPGSDWRAQAMRASPNHDVQGFADHHHAALLDLQRRAAALGPGGQMRAHALAEYSYFGEIMLLIPRMAGNLRVSNGRGAPLNDAELTTLLALRLTFDGDVQPVAPPPPPRGLHLVLNWTDLPNGEALDVPFPPGQEALNAHLRRLDVRLEGADMPEHAQLRIEGPLEPRILSSDGPCSGGGPILCTLTYPYSVTLEMPGLTLPIADEPDTALRLTALAPEGGGWTEQDHATWAVPYRPCSEILRRRLRGLQGPPTSLGTLEQAITDQALPVPELPGTRLFPGPRFTPSPPVGTPSRVMTEDGDALIMRRAIDDLALSRGLDAYLGASPDATGGLHRVAGSLRRMATAQQCDDPQTRGWSQAVRQGLDDLRRGMDRTLALRRDAHAGRSAWETRIRIALRSFEDTRASTPAPSDQTPTETATGVLRPVAVSTLNNMLIVFFAGPDAKTLLSQPMSLVSALRNHLRAGAALFDLATLADLQQDTEEFMAWLEAEAYAIGMMRRYQRAIDATEQALTLLSEAERGSCTCWRP